VKQLPEEGLMTQMYAIEISDGDDTSSIFRRYFVKAVQDFHRSIHRDSVRQVATIAFMGPIENAKVFFLDNVWTIIVDESSFSDWRNGVPKWRNW